MNPLWTTLASRAHLALSESQQSLFTQYLDLIEAANKKMNLTRITDRAAAELNHIADALTILPHLPSTPHTLADVGSGAGIPGIPLAIARPDAQITLIESTKKKAAFLRETASALGLVNVTVLDSRAEDVARTALRDSFDVVTARAVASLDWLVEWCLPLLRPGGTFLAMKGQKVIEELPAAGPAIRLLKGNAPITHPVELPGSEHRVIISITKKAKSDLRFPRPPTTARTPLV